jgi:hypothetical protein
MTKRKTKEEKAAEQKAHDEERIRRIVAGAPPLSPKQRDIIGTIFHPDSRPEPFRLFFKYEWRNEKLSRTEFTVQWIYQNLVFLTWIDVLGELNGKVVREDDRIQYVRVSSDDTENGDTNQPN